MAARAKDAITPADLLQQIRSTELETNTLSGTVLRQMARIRRPYPPWMPAIAKN